MLRTRYHSDIRLSWETTISSEFILLLVSNNMKHNITCQLIEGYSDENISYHKWDDEYQNEFLHDITYGISDIEQTFKEEIDKKKSDKDILF